MKKIMISFFAFLSSACIAQTEQDTLFNVQVLSLKDSGSRTVLCKKHDYYETFKNKKYVITVLYCPYDTAVNMVAISLLKPIKIKGTIFNDGRVYRFQDAPIEDFSIINTGKEMYLQYVKDKRKTKVPFFL